MTRVEARRLSSALNYGLGMEGEAKFMPYGTDSGDYWLSLKKNGQCYPNSSFAFYDLGSQMKHAAKISGNTPPESYSSVMLTARAIMRGVIGANPRGDP